MCVYITLSLRMYMYMYVSLIQYYFLFPLITVLIPLTAVLFPLTVELIPLSAELIPQNYLTQHHYDFRCVYVIVFFASIQNIPKNNSEYDVTCAHLHLVRNIY